MVIDANGVTSLAATFDVGVSFSSLSVNPIDDITQIFPAALHVQGSFTPSGSGYTYTGTVDYGDGNGPQSLTIDQQDFTFTLDHDYATTGLYHVTVTIYDPTDQHASVMFAVDEYTPASISSISPVPPYTNQAVGTVIVTLSEPIDPNSFTTAALTLTFNGNAVSLTGASISQVAGHPAEYAINLGSLASADGAYVLTVDATKLRDLLGNAGVGSQAVPWVMDTVAPTSQVTPLGSSQASLTFNVAASGSDVGSGLASFDLYVSVDGGAFTLWTTVPASNPVAAFTATSNHFYSFYSIGRDLAGNVEAKNAAETTTYVPDLSPPSTSVQGPGSDVTTSKFAIQATGTDAGNSGLAWFDFYVQIDNAGPYTRFAHVPAVAANPGDPNGPGKPYSAVANFQATVDGAMHTYNFYSIGTDGAGNVEAAPSQPEFTTSAQFGSQTTFQNTSFVVQDGVQERSFLQSIDVGFNLGGQPLDDLAANSSTRVQLIRHNLDGSGGTVVPASNYTVSASDPAKVLDLFFGQYGLGGIAKSATSGSADYWNKMILGDGYYELDLELDPAHPGVETQLFFYRLLGDVNGDHVVDGNDTYQIAMAESDSTIFGDANGDGSTDTTDANLAAPARPPTAALTMVCTWMRSGFAGRERRGRILHAAISREFLRR